MTFNINNFTEEEMKEILLDVYKAMHINHEKKVSANIYVEKYYAGTDSITTTFRNNSSREASQSMGIYHTECELVSNPDVSIDTINEYYTNMETKYKWINLSTDPKKNIILAMLQSKNKVSKEVEVWLKLQ